MEVFMPHESPSSYGDAGGEFRDARTGELIFGIPATNDVGRGVAFDIDPNHVGYEVWATVSGAGSRMVYSSQGEPLYSTNGGSGSGDDINYNFGVWWDADPLRELLDGTTISEWRYDLATPGKQTLLALSGTGSNNGTKATPALSGDILGDWREEVIMRSTSNTELRVYTTTIPATNRLYTLLHDAQYRQAIAWQNSGYNQPPHPSFFLGAGMEAPPTPQISIVAAEPLEADFNGDRRVDALDLALWKVNVGRVALTGPVVGDADGDLDVDGGDFLAWQRNVGPTLPMAAAAVALGDALHALTASSDGPSANAIRDDFFARLAGAFVEPNARRTPSPRAKDRPADVASESRHADNDSKPPVTVDGRPALARRDAPASADVEIALAAKLLDESL
jgi:hypothetical protein